MNDPAISLDQDKARLHDILSGREYRSGSGLREEGESWLSKGIGSFFRKISSLLPDHAVPRSASDIFSYLIIIAIAGLIVYVLIRLGRRYGREWKGPSRTALSEAELAHSFEDYLQKAELAKSRLELKEAVRYTFLALLFYADSRDWVQVEKWKANGEYALELKARKPGLMPLFNDAVHMFEEVYYGSREAEPQVCQLLYQRVSQTAAGLEGQG